MMPRRARSEAGRGVGRIIANYARLLATLACGLAVVPILVGWLGDEAFGLISLLGASIGFAALFRELTHRSMVRELGAAWHEDPDGIFVPTYASAWVLAFCVGVCSAIAFCVLIAVIPLLAIPQELQRAAVWFVVAQATHAVLIVLLAPAFNMYVVQERFVEYNAWYVALRASNLVSAVILAYAVAVDDAPTGLIAHGILWAALANIALIASVIAIMVRDRRLVPRLSLASRAHTGGMLSTFGWNSLVQVAMALHERVPPIIINLSSFGLLGNAIWGVAYRFVAYVRMATGGVQFGADAVSARLDADREREDGVRRFTSVQTRLNAVVALPAGLAMFVLAGPLLDVWIGGRVENPDEVLGPATVMARILAVGLTARALSEGWILVLYGAGHVRRYAPLMLAGGVCNPVLAIVLLFTVPTEMRLYVPAIAFTVVITLVNLFILPAIGARCLDAPYASMLTPMLRPVAATALASPVLIFAYARVEVWTLPVLAAVGAGFGALYAPLAFFMVLTQQERRRLMRRVRNSSSDEPPRSEAVSQPGQPS